MDLLNGDPLVECRVVKAFLLSSLDGSNRWVQAGESVSLENSRIDYLHRNGRVIVEDPPAWMIAADPVRSTALQQRATPIVEHNSDGQPIGLARRTR